MNSSGLKCDVGLYESSCCYKCENASKEGFPHPLGLKERFEFKDCPFLLIRPSKYQTVHFTMKVPSPQELHGI